VVIFFAGMVRMTYEQLKARLEALLKQVEQAHNKCKDEEHTVPTLFETFYHVHFLGMAFAEDCQMYVVEQPIQIQAELMDIMANINGALQCSIKHLHLSAEKLNYSGLAEMKTHLQLNKIIFQVMHPTQADPAN
jgi:hypothetical protein